MRTGIRWNVIVAAAIGLLVLVTVGCAPPADPVEETARPTAIETPSADPQPSPAATKAQPTKTQAAPLESPLVSPLVSPLDSPVNTPPSVSEGEATGELGDTIPGRPGADPGYEKLRAAARFDLSTHLGISEEQIRMLSLDHVVWPDASLGCPKPGELYAQVLVPGYRIALEVDAKTYLYHTDETGQFLLCEQPAPNLPLIPVKPGDIDDEIPWVPVE